MNSIMKEEMPLGQYGIPTRMATIHPMWCASRNRMDSTASTVDVVVSAPTPVEEAQADRERLGAAIACLRRRASEEGGDGFVLGRDPADPRMHVRSAELALGVDHVFIWDRWIGEAPSVEWRDVASVSTSDLSIEIRLVDGRSLFLHADVDWKNRSA